MINHQGMFPSATMSFNLKPGYSLGDAVDAISGCEKADRQAGIARRPRSRATPRPSIRRLTGMPILIAAALVVIYIILGVLYENTIHPITILSTLAVRRHRRVAVAHGLAHSI